MSAPPPIQKPRASGMTGVGDIGRQRGEPAFSGGRIKIIYPLAPHYPLLAGLGLSLVPLVGSSRPPRSQAWTHTQCGTQCEYPCPMSAPQPRSTSHIDFYALSHAWKSSPAPSIPVQRWEGVPLQPLRISSPSWPPSETFVTVFSVSSVPCPAAPLY